MYHIYMYTCMRQLYDCMHYERLCVYTYPYMCVGDGRAGHVSDTSVHRAYLSGSHTASSIVKLRAAAKMPRSIRLEP